MTIGHKGGFPAVILSPDLTVYKFWVKRPRLGKLITSRSYAKRFIKACDQLNTEGFTAPRIISHLICQEPFGEIVHYHQLPGDSIRDLLESAPESIDLPKLARIYLDLHEAGFYIRTLHFGNVLQEESGKMTLIDCSNVKKKGSTLSPIQRGKNLAIPLRYKADLERYQNAGLPDFIETYLQLGNFSEADKCKIRTISTQRLSQS